MVGPERYFLHRDRRFRCKSAFWYADPLNMVIRMDNELDLKITGVYEDLPYNTEFKDLKFLAPWDLTIAQNEWMKNAVNSWGNNSFLAWQFKEGRDFSSQYAMDSVGKQKEKTAIPYSVVVNEAAVKYMGLKKGEGEIIKWNGQPLRIIGVIKDMVMESPYEPVRHIIYLVNEASADSWINIR